MQQLNGYILFLLGKWLDSVFLSARAPLNSNIGAWMNAHALLDILIRGDAVLKLNESAPAATALRDIIGRALNLHQQNATTVLSDQDVQVFNNAWATFEQALALDLSRAPVFFVRRKGIYETSALINQAELALAEEVAEAISDEAKRDLNQAGRALAFALGTASAYHALRAVEKVLREYYELVTGKPAGKKNMKPLIDGLNASGKANVKVTAVLDQIRDLHRNPVDHPELFLDVTEALELFDITKSAISAMARQMILLKTPAAP